MYGELTLNRLEQAVKKPQSKVEETLISLNGQYFPKNALNFYRQLNRGLCCHVVAAAAAAGEGLPIGEVMLIKGRERFVAPEEFLEYLAELI